MAKKDPKDEAKAAAGEEAEEDTVPFEDGLALFREGLAELLGAGFGDEALDDEAADSTTGASEPPTSARKKSPAKKKTPARKKSPAKKKAPAKKKTPAKKKSPAKKKPPAKKKSPAKKGRGR